MVSQIAYLTSYVYSRVLKWLLCDTFEAGGFDVSTTAAKVVTEGKQGLTLARLPPRWSLKGNRG